MHPAIRIVDCLLLIFMLASGLPLAFLVAAVITLALLLFSYFNGNFPDITAVWRLRWLFASILILYLVFPPVIIDGWQQQLTASLGEAGMRIVALMAIVILVQILFAMTGRQRVLAGLLWILQPFARLGLPVRSFALRLMLVMEIVPRAQKLLRQENETGPASAGRVQRLVKHLTSVYARVLEEADRSDSHAMEIPVLRRPAVHEWLSPCLLAGLMFGIMMAA